MLVLLSPSKTLDEKPISMSLEVSEPYFKKEIHELITVLKQKSADDLLKLMDISKKIADLNYARYQEFSQSCTKQNSKPSLFMFKGDVYNSMKVQEYNNEQMKFAQEHIYILSGLYGLLRPLDLMQPYRLEMGTKLKTKFGKDLYEFWGDRITNIINTNPNSECVINLASNEYFSAVVPSIIKGRLINVDFKVRKGEKLQIIGIIAKRARGAMADFIISNQIENSEDLKEFVGQGFVYDKNLSSVNNFIFTK